MDYTIKCQQCGKEIPIRDRNCTAISPQTELQHWCKRCNAPTTHTYVLTKKLQAFLKKQQQERELKDCIEELCKEHGFLCRFVYRSVVITTPLSDWCFDYHESRKTLWHESTVKINFETGDYAKAHCQLENRKMTIEETISYIAEHEEWVKNNRPSKSNTSD